MPRAISHKAYPISSKSTYTRAVWRMPILFIIVSHLVEVILVELAHEAGEIAMFEMFGKDRLGEAFILRRESA